MHQHHKKQSVFLHLILLHGPESYHTSRVGFSMTSREIGHINLRGTSRRRGIPLSGKPGDTCEINAAPSIIVSRLLQFCKIMLYLSIR